VKMKACIALLAVVAIAANANAAKLVVISTNSGTGSTNGAFPPVGPGQMGFLIGIDCSTDPQAPLGFQNVTFSGPIVQRLAPVAASTVNPDADPPANFLASPIVQTRSQALIANANGDGVAGSTFGANDSWWWDSSQTVGGTAYSLTPLPPEVSPPTDPPTFLPDYIGGAATGDPMTVLAGSYKISGSVNPGVYRLAYLVTTGPVLIQATLASGQNGFDPLGGGGTPGYAGGQAMLTMDGQIVPVVPEPSTIVLAALGLVGLGVGAWRRRK
jgi:PEP-CTERM motif